MAKQKFFYNMTIGLTLITLSFSLLGCKQANNTKQDETEIVSGTEGLTSTEAEFESVSEVIASEYDTWLESMQPIYSEIEGLKEPIRKAFAAGFSCEIAKEELSEDYIKSIEKICKEIEDNKAPNSNIEKKNQELCDALNKISSFAQNIGEKIEEREYQEENDFYLEQDVTLHANYVLTNMDPAWQEIDSSIDKYVSGVNTELKKSNPEGKEIAIDFAITEDIANAIEESNLKTLTIFAEEHFPNNRWEYSYYEGLLITDDYDVKSSWNTALVDLETGALPSCNKMNQRFAGTLLSDVCAEYTLYLQDYQEALNYAISASDDLGKEAKNIPSGIFVRNFATWIKPYISVHQVFYTYDPFSPNAYQVMASDSKYWNRLWIIGLNPDEIIRNNTLEEACNLYLEASIQHYSDYAKPGETSPFYPPEMKLSQMEYQELTSYYTGEASSKEKLDSKVQNYRAVLSDKIDKYQASYLSYSDKLTEVTSQYEDFDIFEVSGLNFSME